MENPPNRSFGFEYEHGGKRYAGHVLAAGPEQAKSQIAALAGAEYVGELCRHENTTPDSCV